MALQSTNVLVKALASPRRVSLTLHISRKLSLSTVRPRCSVADGASDSAQSSGERKWSSRGGSDDDQSAMAYYNYLVSLQREPPELERLRTETSSRMGANMMSSVEQVCFLAWMVESLSVKKIVEVGVFTGYSSLAMALALPEDGQLFALEKDSSALEVAQRHWQDANVGFKIKLMEDDAMASLDRLISDGQEGTFDMAFLDADKRKYGEYFNKLLKLVRVGGIIVVDNVLWYGRCADETVTDKVTVSIREFNQSLLRDGRISLSVVPVGDGLALCRRRN